MLNTPLIPTSDRPKILPKNICTIHHCQCPGCPTTFRKMQRLKFKLEHKICEPSFKTLLSCDFTLEKWEIEYLFELIESDQLSFSINK